MKIVVNIEVAIAMWIGRQTMRSRFGTIKAPSPMPSKPEESPPKKLKIEPSMIFASYSNMLPPESTILQCQYFNALNILGAVRLKSNSILNATRRRKGANMMASTVLLMKLVRYAPTKAPGIVATAEIRPTLLSILPA